MSEQFTNNAITTLNGGINNSTTSIVVASATNFPSSGNFRIIVDSEIMLVTAVSGTTFTVTRGSESTTPVSHNDAATVTHILTAGALSQFKTDTISTIGLTGTTAALPAAGTAGRMYFPTDGTHIYQDSGSAWQAWGPIVPTSPPNSASFSWVNQGSSTLISSNGTMTLSSPANSNTDGMRMLVKNLATGTSGHYTATFGLIITLTPYVAGGYSMGGIVLRNSSSGNLINYLFRNDNNNWNRGAYKFTNPTTYSGALYYDTLPANSLISQPLWHRITDDGVNRIFSISQDSYNFLTIHTIGRTDYITPDQIGILTNPFNAPAMVTCFSYTEV